MRDALRADGVPVEDAAVALAEMKAAHVAARAPADAIVLGADQLLELEGEWLEKPVEPRRRARPAAAAARPAASAGRAAVVAFRGGSRVWHHVDVARLWLRPFSDAFLDGYLDCGGAEAVLGCVGAYQLEGLGAQLMARVEGDYFTMLGLPLLPLLQFLRDQGVLAT